MRDHSTPKYNIGSQQTYGNQQTPHQSPSDGSQSNLNDGEANDWEESEGSDLECSSEAEPVIADRWVPQPRSRSGYLAYVIFIGANTGVFYNWNAASAARMGDEAVYKGYPTIQLAHQAWNEFCKKKILPAGLSDRTLSYDGSARQVANSSRTPQHSPASPSLPRMHHTNVTRTPPPSYRSHNTGTTIGSASSSHCDLHQTIVTNPPGSVSLNNITMRPRNFSSTLSTNYYVVLTGLAPGVYGGRQAAETALGPLAIATFKRTGSREEANHIFVSEYMAGTVARFV